MNFYTIFTPIAAAATIANGAPEAKKDLTKNVNKDSIIFKDGGNFYGQFKGLTADSNILWLRDGAKNTQRFPLKEISQIAINGKRPQVNAPQLGVLKLVNGDSLPGTLTKLTDKKITLLTSYSGSLSFDRSYVKSFHPVPLGSGVIFNGFNKNQNWKQVPYKNYATSNPRKEAWQLNGGSWYANTNKCGLLNNPDLKLPDSFVVAFDMAFLGRSSFNIALHSDLIPPLSRAAINKLPAEKKKGLRFNQSSGAANTIGNGLNLRLQANYADLQSCGVKKDNSIFNRRHNNNIRNSMLWKNGESQRIEIRGSRVDSELNLYVNGKLVSSWSLGAEDYPKKGNQLAFFSDNGSQGSVRISNLIVSEWSGVKDPARSHFSKAKDILLHTNGTDRFSGKVTSIENKMIFVENDYSPIKLPLDNVRVLNFAQNQLKELNQDTKAITVRFYNNGVLSGTPVKPQSKGSISMKTQYNQIINLPIKNIKGIEMEELSALINSWSIKH